MNVAIDGRIDLSVVKYVAADAGRARLTPGDVLFNNTNSPALVGKTAYVDAHGDLAFSNHMTRLRANRTSPKFIALQLQLLQRSGYFQYLCVKHVNQASINTEVLTQAIPIVVAPLREQERIVAAIEEQFSRLDAAEASLGDCLRRLPALRRAALQAAFPQEWQAKALVELTDPDRPICYGILKPRSEKGEIPYVEVRSIRDGVIDVSSLHRTATALHKEFQRSELRTDDVVLAIRGSWDRAAVVPAILDGANVSRDVARIAPLDSILPAFLAYFLESPRAQEYYARHARGVGVRGINIGDLRRLEVPVPDLAEQRAVVVALELQLTLIGSLATALDRARIRSDQLRRTMLSEAFSGRLVPQDPNDEPASDLLTRIAAEWPEAPTPRQRKRA